MLKRVVLAIAVLAFAVVAPSVTASADSKAPAGPLTLAVFGDTPYGVTAYAPASPAQLDNSWQRQLSPDFIATINDDPSVSEAIHVGDIHSGKQFCTEAYDTDIAQLWQSFTKPLVYTPGDNEWSDCHKAAEGGGTYNKATGQIDYVPGPDGNPADYAGGDPIANLELVRSLFFAQPGVTLGGRP